MDKKDANGTKGCLIRTRDEVIFRVYDKDHNFVDYDLRHSDLDVTITDPDSTFYYPENGEPYLDHCPKTLGKE